MMRSTVLLVIALAAGTGYADDAKKDAPKAAEPAKDAAKDAPKDAPKDASGATAEVKVGTGVEKHEIVGEATSFPAGTTVWVWSRILNGEGNVKHVWKLDGKEVAAIPLNVPSKRFATFSRHTVNKAGAWSVEVMTDAGATIGKVEFTVN